MPPERLARMRESARAESISASCGMAGVRVSEAEVTALLAGSSASSDESRQVLGYAEAMNRSFPALGPLVTTEEIRGLHAVAMGAAEEPPPPTPWREEPYHLEVFDASGCAVGRVFQTLPPRLVSETMEDITTWLELELRERRNHPAVVVGAFLLYFIAACPFSRGNGRVAHLMNFHLLLRAGYEYLPYASVEGILEQFREEYFDALDQSQTRLWTGEADLRPWLGFYLRVLEQHAERVQAKVEVERRALDFTPLQRKIVETVREHGTVAAGLVMKATGANRNTLKDNLRRLVDQGILEKLGERRGTRYRLAARESLSTVGAPELPEE